MAFGLLSMKNSGNTLALWWLTQQLLEAGVDIYDSDHEVKFYSKYFFHSFWGYSTNLSEYRPLCSTFHENIFSGYRKHFPSRPASQINTNAKDVLDFLSWFVDQDAEILPPSRLRIVHHETETRPWSGFRTILNALQSSEVFRTGMLSTFSFMVYWNGGYGPIRVLRVDSRYARCVRISLVTFMPDKSTIVTGQCHQIVAPKPNVYYVFHLRKRCLIAHLVLRILANL